MQLYGMKILIWLLDSSISQHMIGRLEFLLNIHAIPSCFIGLANGSYIVSNSNKTIYFGN